jgi:hypothetical protein
VLHAIQRGLQSDLISLRNPMSSGFGGCANFPTWVQTALNKLIHVSIPSLTVTMTSSVDRPKSHDILFLRWISQYE